MLARTVQAAIANAVSKIAEFGGARTRADACIEHVAAEKDEVRYPSRAILRLTLFRSDNGEATSRRRGKRYPVGPAKIR